MNVKEKRDIALKTKVLNYTDNTKNVAKICRYFSISRQTYYTWKKPMSSMAKKG